MSEIDRTVRSSLLSKIATDGNWDQVETNQNEELLLQIHVEPGRHEDAEDAVKGVGGEIKQNSGKLEDATFTQLVAQVLASDVTKLAGSDAIRLLGEWVEPQEHEIKPAGVDIDTEWEPTSSHLPKTEGIEITGVDQLHNEDITGEGTTIAVLDSFFNVNNEQYADQIVGTLGEGQTFFSFGQLYESPGAHGDAVADVVAAMAPDADIVVGTVFDPFFGIFEALDEIEEKFPEVDVATMSVGYLMDNPINGTDAISARINEFTNENRIFTNSAGNEAPNSDFYRWNSQQGQVNRIPVAGSGAAYDGPFVDNSGNGLMEFDDTFVENLDNSERLPVIPGAGVTLSQEADDASLGWIITHWDADPVVDDQRYRVRLYGSPNATDPLTYPSSGDPVVSETNNPWETIDALAGWFNVSIDMADFNDEAWLVGNTVGSDTVVTSGGSNPTLNLQVGRRYVFKNGSADAHPLAFRDDQGNVLLSQDQDGSFEDDSGVAWEETGDQIEFTYTAALAAEMAEYISEANSSQMQGDVAVAGSERPKIYVEVENTGADGSHHFDVWGQFGDVQVPTPWATPERTVGIPAVSQDPDLWSIAAVQAVDVGGGSGETRLAFEKNKGDLKSYSSRGPTQDGRQGVHFAGPSHVSTNARGPVEDVFGFNGTSAAAPHIGAVAGLLSDTDLDATPAEIREALAGASGGIPDPDVGGPPNTTIGFGYADAYNAYTQLASDGDVSIQIQGSIPLPNRTLLVDQDEKDKLGNDQYTLTAVKTATPGDSLEVNTAAPTGKEYNLELRDSDLNVQGTWNNKQGNSTATVDTTGLATGTYLLAAVVDNTAVTVFPLVLQGYETEITSAPDQLTTGDTMNMTVTLTEAVSNPESPKDVMLFGFTDNDDAGIAYLMDEVVADEEYEVSIADPPQGEYQLHAAPRGSANLSFTIFDSTLESDSEPIGLSGAEFVTVELGNSDALSQIWTQDSGALSSNVQGRLQFARPEIDNENVFAGGLGQYVTAHARNSGDMRWNVQRSGALSDSGPVLYNGTVYIGDGGGLLHAIDAADGTIKWSYDTATETQSAASAITSTPAVFDDGSNVWVFFGSNNGTVHAVMDNGSSFTQKWTQNVNAAVYSDIEVGTLFGVPWVVVTTNNGRVKVLDILGQETSNAGELLVDFNAPTESFGSSSPLFDNGTLYVAGNIVASVDVEATVNQGNLSNLPITQVVANWTQTNYGGTAGSNPTLSPDGNALYVGSADNNVYSILTTDGSIDWTASTGGTVSGSPAVTSDRVVVGSHDGTLYVFDRATGVKEGSRTVGDPIQADTIVMNDTVYLGTETGEVVKLKNIP